MTYLSVIRSCVACLAAITIASCSHVGPQKSADPENLRLMPKNVFSLESEVPAGLLIRNESKHNIAVYWVGYKGERHPQTTIKAGGVAPVGGYMGHAFIIEDDSDGPQRGKLLRIAYPDFPTGETIIRDEDFVDIVTHSKECLHDWTLHIEKSIPAADQQKILKRMDQLLLEIVEVVPPKELPFLKSVPMWFDKDAGADRGQYHPGYYWMKGSGWHLEKRQAIHFGRINTLERAYRTQPLVVLHELSHAFHDQVLGFDDKRIIAAYKNAKSLKLYEKIQHVGGKVGRAYAMTNEREYFAELTEAYFGRNDFYPFNRAELRQHDPIGYAMIEATWGL